MTVERNLLTGAAGNIVKPGNAYFPLFNSGFGYVARVTQAGVVNTTWANTGTIRVERVCVTPGGTLYIATNDSGNSIYKTSTTGGSVTYVGGTAVVAISLATAPDGSAYFLSSSGNSLSRVSSAGVFTANWVTGISYLSSTAVAICCDSSGNIYVAGLAVGSTAVISKITPAGTLTTNWASLASGSDPRYLVCDSNDNIFALTNNAIAKVTSAGVITNNWATGVGFYGTDFMAIDSSNNLYAASAGSANLVKITPSAVVSTLTSSLQLQMSALACDASGNIWASNSGVSNGYKISPAGVITTYAGAGPGYGVAVY